MDNARRTVYQTIVDTVKRKFTGVSGEAQDNVPPIVKSYAVCKPTMSYYDKLMHCLLLGASCRAEQIHCHR